MEFQAAMQNLAVGIVGGIFSSIIVSVVFYVLNEFQSELDKANKMVYNLYGIILLDGKTIETKVLHNVSESYKYYYEKTIVEFSTFEPWEFKYELKEVMCEINNIINSGKYCIGDGLDSEKIGKFSEEIQPQLNKIEKQQRNFAKEFVKRIFKNKIIIINLVIFMAIIVIA